MRAQAENGRPVKSDRARRLIGGVILFVVVIGRPTVYAQAPAPAPAPNSAAAADASLPVEAADPVRLLVGRSTIVDVGKPIARVSLTSADIADAHVTAPSELLLNGKTPGTISMFVWDRGGAIRRYDVFVQRDLSRLTEQFKQLFPGEAIEVRANGRTAVLSGAVSSKDVIEKAGALAASFVEKKEDLVNLLQIRDGAPSNQVLLRVRFAEVSRSALTELGLGLFTSPTGIENTIGRVTTQQFPAPGFDELTSTKEGPDAFKFGGDVTSSSGKFTFSDFLNLFLYSQKYDLGMTIRALQTRGLFQSLAEPNLVAESGKEASFLAGGEFPIPIAQASSSGTSITVQFKEFGVRLNFTPTVNGDRVHLKVRPEVSTLDFNNAIVLNGFRIPALTTRRTETELELQNGQTFAIAGLINNNMISSVQKVPGIGDIPILGLLFRSKAAQKQQTELVVMITPEILPNNSSGVTTDLPRQQEPYLAPLPQQRSVPPPPPAFQGSTAKPTTQPVVQRPDASPAISAGSSPAATTAPAAAGTAVAAPKPMTSQERQALERAQKEERERAANQARIDAAEAKRLAKQQKEDNERLERAAKAQKQRDAEAAKRAAEQAKKQAELERERDREAAAAARRLRAAQEAYEAELSKLQRKQ